MSGVDEEPRTVQPSRNHDRSREPELKKGESWPSFLSNANDRFGPRTVEH